MSNIERRAKITKSDLGQAYQQLLLDEKSSNYLTINAHKGLFDQLGFNLEFILLREYSRGKWKVV